MNLIQKLISRVIALETHRMKQIEVVVATDCPYFRRVTGSRTRREQNDGATVALNHNSTPETTRLLRIYITRSIPFNTWPNSEFSSLSETLTSDKLPLLLRLSLSTFSGTARACIFHKHLSSYVYILPFPYYLSVYLPPWETWFSMVSSVHSWNARAFFRDELLSLDKPSHFQRLSSDLDGSTIPWKGMQRNFWK